MRAFAVLSGATLSAAVLAACNGGATEPPFLSERSPTPTQEATSAPEPTPSVAPADLDGFREFAPEVEAAVRVRDVDFFVDAAVISTAICSEEDYIPSLRCDELPLGTRIDGIWVGGWRSEGFLASMGEFRDSLNEYFSSLTEPTLYAIASLDRNVGGLIGGPAVFVIVASEDDLQDTTRIFEFVEENGSWRMPNVIKVSNLADEWLSGECSECYDRWERWESTW